MKKKKVVYLAHALSAPTREGIDANRALASKWVAWACVSAGVVPVATWIVLTGQLTEEFRSLGLEIDCATIERCDEVWLVGACISSGMLVEARHALEHGIPVFDLTGEVVPSGETDFEDATVFTMANYDE